MLACVPQYPASFPYCIGALTLTQAAVVALPRPRDLPALTRFRSGWWAALPALSVVAFVFGLRALSGAADGLAYLALFAVPPLAGLALAGAVRGSRPWLAALAPALFALAWVDRSGYAGEVAAIVLEALSAVTLAVALVAVAPRLLVKLGILAMAAVDVWLVASDLLSAPNSAFNAVTPVAHLPQLQSATFGSAVLGYGDLFVAALLGALLASQPRIAARAVALAATLGLVADLLFFFVSELPATAPIALTLLILEALQWRRARGQPQV
jgi:hypothetical protein